VNDARDTHFDEVQANAFLDWAKREREELYPHFLTLIDTGVRLNEMMALRVTSFGGGVVRVRRPLTSGKTLTRDIPLTEDMEELVRGWKGKRATSKLYAVGSGETKWDVNRLGLALNRALREGCAAIGLESLAEGDGRMRVHDLRHTFAYLTAKAGADVGDLQYLMGHEDISMTMRYRGFIQSRARTYVGRARCAVDVSGQVGCVKDG
jgi:integrase